MYCTCKMCPGILKKRRGEPVKVSYFRFPKDEKIARKWVIFCGRPRNYNYKNARLCSLHFKTEDIIFNKAAEMGLSTKGNKLRPGAIPSIKTEEDVDRENLRIDEIMREKRKKMVDDIINNSKESHINETSENSQNRDPMRECESKNSKESIDMDFGEVALNTAKNESPKENLVELLALQKDFDILLERNKFSKNVEKLKLILEMKNEYEELFAKNVCLRKKRSEHVEHIEDLNRQIGDYKIQKYILNEQFESCKHLGVEKYRAKRVWTKIEIETAFETFMRSHREYRERCRTEYIPSIGTLQQYRRDKHPYKKRGKYKLYCIEDTVERGVKNLGFEMETFEPKYQPILPEVAATSGRYVFPEETKERGVADLLDNKTLAYNNIILFDETVTEIQA